MKKGSRKNIFIKKENKSADKIVWRWKIRLSRVKMKKIDDAFLKGNSSIDTRCQFYQRSTSTFYPMEPKSIKKTVKSSVFLCFWDPHAQKLCVNKLVYWGTSRTSRTVKYDSNNIFRGVTYLEYRSNLLIYESILTTFKPSIVFRDSWAVLKIGLSLKPNYHREI